MQLNIYITGQTGKKTLYELISNAELKHNTNLEIGEFNKTLLDKLLIIDILVYIIDATNPNINSEDINTLKLLSQKIQNESDKFFKLVFCINKTDQDYLHSCKKGKNKKLNELQNLIKEEIQIDYSYVFTSSLYTKLFHELKSNDFFETKEYTSEEQDEYLDNVGIYFFGESKMLSRYPADKKSSFSKKKTDILKEIITYTTQKINTEFGFIDILQFIENADIEKIIDYRQKYFLSLNYEQELDNIQLLTKYFKNMMDCLDERNVEKTKLLKEHMYNCIQSYISKSEFSEKVYDIIMSFENDNYLSFVSEKVKDFKEELRNFLIKNIIQNNTYTTDLGLITELLEKLHKYNYDKIDDIIDKYIISNESLKSHIANEQDIINFCKILEDKLDMTLLNNIIYYLAIAKYESEKSIENLLSNMNYLKNKNTNNLPELERLVNGIFVIIIQKSQNIKASSIKLVSNNYILEDFILDKLNKKELNDEERDDESESEDDDTDSECNSDSNDDASIESNKKTNKKHY